MSVADAPAAARRAALDPKALALLVGAAMFMQALDSTIIATALPQIGASLHQPVLRLDVAITSYVIGSAAALPLSGWLADRFGAKRVFCAAILGFVVTSAVCAAAQTLPQMIAARTLQGIAGAMLMPVGRIILLKAAPKSELIELMTYLALPPLLGPLIGPPLGGFLATALSWRWIFLINLPIGLAGFLLVLRLVDNRREEEVAPLDIGGAAISAAALVGLAYGFELVAHAQFAAGWSLALAGLAATAFYLWHSRRARHPILDLGLLKTPSFSISVIASLLSRLSIGAAPYLLVVGLQVTHGMSGLASGAMILIMAIGSFLMRTVAKDIFVRLGFRPALTVGALLTGLSFVAFALFERPGASLIILGVLLLIHGFARSVQISGLNALGFADIPERRMSAASSLMSVSHLLAQCLGIAAATLILDFSRQAMGAPRIGDAQLTIAYAVLGALAAGSALAFAWLPREAGDNLIANRT